MVIGARRCKALRQGMDEENVSEICALHALQCRYRLRP